MEINESSKRKVTCPPEGQIAQTLGHTDTHARTYRYNTQMTFGRRYSLSHRAIGNPMCLPYANVFNKNIFSRTAAGHVDNRWPFYVSPRPHIGARRCAVHTVAVLAFQIIVE